jgi:hypothetical protein
MHTINKNISLTLNNKLIEFHFSDLPAGDYQAILILEKQQTKIAKKFIINTFKSNSELNTTFSREDIYDEES